MEGMRLFSREDLFKNNGGEDSELVLFETDPSLPEEAIEKQAPHTMDAVKMMEFNLKETLIKLMKELFGSDIEARWTTCYFPSSVLRIGDQVSRRVDGDAGIWHNETADIGKWRCH